MRKSFLAGIMLLSFLSVNAQQAPIGVGQYPPPVTFTQKEDQENMIKQLGITVMRPGFSGDEKAPNHANYDEALANPYPNYPEVLTLKNGKKVTTPAEWWNQRRPELVADFESEIYGHIPKNTPKVTWTVKLIDHEFMGFFIPVVAKQLVGHVDNSSYPLIDVNIRMTLVVPENAKKPVPLLMMFSPGSMPAPSQPAVAQLQELNKALQDMLIAKDPSLKAVFEEHPAYDMLTSHGINPFAPPGPGDPPTTEQLIAAGWGYIQIDPTSVQADDGAGLTRGIIGLMNKGQPRKPDDWGALRAWEWGAARALDYLEANEPMVDAKHVGIEGVSRYGKAATVTEAFEPRFAFGLLGSTGQGGVKPNRRNFGESLENIAGGGYYWVAGNYMKYATDAGTYGKKTYDDLPVESHELIALCAPRPTFISFGVPEKGDANWLDHQGSYMAAVAAGPVFKLLGARDLGVSNDYHIEKKPSVNTGLLDGELAWRQHDGGHTDAPNIKYFIAWADKMMGRIK